MLLPKLEYVWDIRDYILHECMLYVTRAMCMCKYEILRHMLEQELFVYAKRNKANVRHLGVISKFTISYILILAHRDLG